MKKGPGPFFAALAGGAVAFVVLAAQPIASRWVHLGEIVAVVVIVASATALLARRRRARWVPAGAAAVLVLPLLLPGRPHDPSALRDAYVDELRSHEGVAYVWGAESPWALDCSGLVRVAMRDACLRRGLREANPALLRRVAGLWWNDASARALGDEHRGWTVRVGETLTVATARDAEAGDLAVTEDGVHVLAHLGGGEWIQASPSAMETIVQPADAADPWHHRPARIVRWSLLQGAGDAPSSARLLR